MISRLFPECRHPEVQGGDVVDPDPVGSRGHPGAGSVTEGPVCLSTLYERLEINGYKNLPFVYMLTVCYTKFINMSR